MGHDDDDDDDAWNELFSRASEEPANFLGKSSRETGKRKDKKRKRGKVEQTKDQKFLQMLASRMKPHSICDLDSISDNNQWQMIAYRDLQTLRSQAYALATGATEKKITRKNVRTLAALDLSSVSDQGEVEVLRRKVEQVIDYVTKSEHSPSFDSWVRIIIACDDLYLRIYYLQTSGSLLPPYVPHPTQYFASNINQSEEDKKLKKLTKKKRNIRTLFGIGEKGGHSLFVIYQQRKYETLKLFQSYDINGIDTQRVLNKQNKASPSSLAYHETVAAPMLMQWRDSCRDVMCNLFCYACVTPSTLSSITDKLNKTGVEEIIELGSGTGYFAKLLKDYGLRVKAYDLNPPCSDFNDYHGKTQPFTTIVKGTDSTVFKEPISQATALLLCYPPPNCTMAYDCTTVFLKVGGTCIIHVGEWKGLTGSKRFEELLVKEFECVYRAPCPTWGTDAASVSLWKKCDTSRKTEQVLLPCIACGEKESIRRCRLIRHAVYCSEACFNKHENEFRVICQLSMIPAPLFGMLSFTSDLHFQPL